MYTPSNNVSGNAQQQRGGPTYPAHIAGVGPHAGSTYDQWLQPNTGGPSLHPPEAIGLPAASPTSFTQTSGKRKAPANSRYPGTESSRQKAPRLLPPQSQLSTQVHFDGDQIVTETPGEPTMVQLRPLPADPLASTGVEAGSAQIINNQERASSILPLTENPNSGQTQPTHDEPQPDIPRILPPEKVFPIQIGTELFRLSGASISSDGSSFTSFPLTSH